MNAANAFLYDTTLDIMQPGNNDRILEIGFGNGKFFDKIFTKAHDLQLTGIDFSEKMLREAQKNNTDSIVSGKLKLHYGSSDNLPFPDNHFDKVFCINVVYFWDPPLPHLQEIHRVLKPGGHFYSVIRSRKSIEQMPFSNYGFIKYEQDEWLTILTGCRYKAAGIKVIKEPEAKLKGKSYPVESWCFVAKKES